MWSSSGFGMTGVRVRLGPLLFLIYIYVIVEYIVSKLEKFADDKNYAEESQITMMQIYSGQI